MKKNLLLGMLAASGMLFATSCSNDELITVQSGDEVQVSFALGLEGNLASRGISDGAKADKLVYAVYKKNATTGEAELQNVVGSTNGQFVKNDFKSGDNVSITLAKGQTYQVAFWAQDGDCNAYTTTDLKNVKVDYANAANNDELRDAFYKTVEFTVSGNKTIDVVLKRPFAQVNVGVYKSDWEAAEKSGITIKESAVVIKKAASTINLLTGAVGGEEDVTVSYSSSAIPSEDLEVDLNKDGDFDDDNEKYKWLSMSYILVADHDEVKDENGLLGTDRVTLTGLEYTFIPEKGNPIDFKEGLSGAPVQRNWRTNILGKILTGDVQFNITIDPVYDGENNNEQDWGKGYTYDEPTKTYSILSAEGFKELVSTMDENEGFEGMTLKLDTDIDLFKGYMPDGDPITTAPIGDKTDVAFKGTFDGQGHSIKNLYQNGWALNYEWGVYGSIGLFRELENATVKNLVIEDMEALIEGGDISFIAGSATGTCVFENIEIKNSTIGTYNNGCGGIIGWSGAGEYTFKNIKIGSDVVLGGLWGSFDSSIGGIVGQAEPGATYNFENVEINCRIDAYNDCTASYDYYNYRMCGMIIGRCQETTTIDGKNYPDLSKYNLSFNNVVVNYGDWMNYHYCEPTPGLNGGRGMRVEPGYAYDGLPADFDHSQCVDNHMNCIPFNQLIGGDQLGVKGLPAVDGVTVNYPYTFNQTEATDADGVISAITAGGNVKLADNVDISTIQLSLAEGQKIDLNGYTLTTANNWGGITMKNGASIKNGVIVHTGNTAAIKVSGEVNAIENVKIQMTSTATDKIFTGIQVYNGKYIKTIKDVVIEGVHQGIEVAKGSRVDLIENVTVNANRDKGVGLLVNAASVGKAVNCNFKGNEYGVHMMLNGEFHVGLELVNCTVEGATASIWGHDEKGISNTNNCSLTLTYDAATTLNGPFIWDFEEECQSVVTLNKPE